MKTFKEYFLTEMSQEIENIPLENIELAKEYFEEKYKNNKKFIKQLSDNLFLLNVGFKSTEFILFSVENNIITGAVEFQQTGVVIDKVEHFAYTPLFTISFGRKNFMELSYTVFSKLKKAYIMSDKKQTSFSKNIWKNWYKTKKVFAYNFDTKEVIKFEDIEDSWCKDVECRKYRLVIKF